jgi:hypothetical protein
MLIMPAGCGESGEGGSAFLTVALTPETAYVVGGNGTSCGDANGTGGRSVAPFRVYFTNFELDWTSASTLYVFTIRATISSSVFEADQVIEIDEQEIEALLGATGGKIIGPKKINSNTAKGNYAACGYSVGGITIPDGVTTFSGTLRVDVYGYSVNTAGEQTPVRQSATAAIQYL